MTPEELRAARIAEAWRLSDGTVADAMEHLADLYETNWTPPETVDPDRLAAREWASVEWKSNQINRMTGDRDYAAKALAGAFDGHPTIRAYLAGCTRGRERATAEFAWPRMPECGPGFAHGWASAISACKAALASAKRGG